MREIMCQCLFRRGELEAGRARLSPVRAAPSWDAGPGCFRVRLKPWLWVLVLIGLAAGCASPVRKGKSLPDSGVLAQELNTLTGGTAPVESRLLAETALRRCRELAGAYRSVRPALFHNCLVNCRLRPRGLCHHWAEDLGYALVNLDLEQFDVHWGVARAGTVREHNTVVITAQGRPFAEGLVLDPWRHSGRLVWVRVLQDRFPWREYDSKSSGKQ